MKKRTQRIEHIKAELRNTAVSNGLSPGQRFLSNRAVAERYQINYRTAHRLLCELEEESLLIRKPFSGSYLPGAALPTRVRLVASPTAKTVNNLKHYSLDRVKNELDRRQIQYHITFANRWRGGNPDEYFVFFGTMYNLRSHLEKIRRALYINIYATPIPLAVTDLQLDMITVDQEWAGKLAAQHFLKTLSASGRVAFARNKSDTIHDVLFEPLAQSFPDARILEITERSSGRYGFGKEAASVAAQCFDGIFCTSPKIASEILSACSSLSFPPPKVICMDRYKYSESRQLTAVTIPYEDPVTHAVRIISKRMNGDQSPPIKIMLKPSLKDRDTGKTSRLIAKITD